MGGGDGWNGFAATWLTLLAHCVRLSHDCYRYEHAMRDIHNCKASSRAAELVHRPLRNPRGLYWAENAISWEKH
jgi:hypothetical protein